MAHFLKHLIKDKIIDAAEYVIDKLNSDDEDEYGDESEVDESKLSFLHGRLLVHVIAAEDLPDTDTVFFNIDGKDVTDPYVVGSLGPARLFKTKYIANCLNPNWDEKFDIMVCHPASSLHIEVKDKEHIGDTYIAGCSVRVEDLVDGSVHDGWFDLQNGDKNMGRLRISLQYIAKETDQDELGGCLELKKSYFPAREGNRVTLYQDADTPWMSVFENVLSPGGKQYKPTTCWKDLFAALTGAERFIYITGWSVFTETNLVRGDDDPDGASNIGQLLKAKAEAGVKVLLMVWDEKLSTESCPGLMGTHDEATRRFFKGTGVECALVSRAKKEGILASEFVGSCYTHHQKTVICDAPTEDGSGKRVISFIGGLDITDGRYDNPEFNLYSTINTLHKGEFCNNCIPGVTAATGPREPWHDCHAKVEGPTALDIMKNFEERWRNQVDDRVMHLLHLGDDPEFVLDALGPDHLDEGGLWSVQLFRSITTDSCEFDFDRQSCLHSKFGKLVENSILRCMVQRIRDARNFLYLENQYFLGSAYSWFNDKDTLTMHIVPREITQKITEKIAAGERFHAYILIPMFPEGDPATAAIQEILFWQHRTMETMYRRIAKAIEEFDAGTVPMDYLSFYCLGKRESPDEFPDDQLETPDASAVPFVARARASRRHPIYVHSKMTIIDDDYVLVGSANVNQRSLGGNRDSEIAVGAFQPDHTEAEVGHPTGGVHTYRMALWAAHLGGWEEAYSFPASEDCLDKVREVTRGYWDAYTAEEPTHCDVHMLPYPVNIGEFGRVTPLEEPWNKFPDTDASVMGAKSGYLPGKLTT